MALVLGLTHTQIGNGGSSPLKVTRILEGYLDLTGLWKDPIAATLLLRARGQLNCAYRAKGLEPPDSLPAHGSADAADPPSAQELDDPCCRWAGGRPGTLAGLFRPMGVRHAERRGCARACDSRPHP